MRKFLLGGDRTNYESAKGHDDMVSFASQCNFLLPVLLEAPPTNRMSQTEKSKTKNKSLFFLISF